MTLEFSAISHHTTGDTEMATHESFWVSNCKDVSFFTIKVAKIKVILLCYLTHDQIGLISFSEAIWQAFLICANTSLYTESVYVQGLRYSGILKVWLYKDILHDQSLLFFSHLFIFVSSPMPGTSLVFYTESFMFELPKGSKVCTWPRTVNIRPKIIFQLLTWLVI